MYIIEIEVNNADNRIQEKLSDQACLRRQKKPLSFDERINYYELLFPVIHFYLVALLHFFYDGAGANSYSAFSLDTIF